MGQYKLEIYNKRGEISVAISVRDRVRFILFKRVDRIFRYRFVNQRGACPFKSLRWIKRDEIVPGGGARRRVFNRHIS